MAKCGRKKGEGSKVIRVPKSLVYNVEAMIVTHRQFKKNLNINEFNKYEYYDDYDNQVSIEDF